MEINEILNLSKIVEELKLSAKVKPIELYTHYTVNPIMLNTQNNNEFVVSLHIGADIQRKNIGNKTGHMGYRSPIIRISLSDFPMFLKEVLEFCKLNNIGYIVDNFKN